MEDSDIDDPPTSAAGVAVAGGLELRGIGRDFEYYRVRQLTCTKGFAGDGVYLSLIRD